MNDAIFKQIRELVAIRSTADNCPALKQAVNYMAKLLADDTRITIERFERNNKPSLLAYFGPARPKRFDVLLNGHVDIVPAANEQLFTVRQDNNRLYGRGTLDMKTAALVLTDVFKTVGPQANYKLGLQIVADEEVGGHNGTAYQIEQGVLTDFMLAGEFTPAGAICVESRGIAWVRLCFSGTTAHSAYLWNGNNAILQAVDAMQKVLADYPLPRQEVWETTVNVTSLATSNITYNQVPADAELRLDCRYISGDPRFKDQATLKKYLHTIAPKADVHIETYEPGHKAKPSDATLTQLAEAVKKYSEEPLKFIRKYGAADIRYYSTLGSTAVVFGVSGANPHSDTEYAEVDSIGRYHRTLSDFLKNYQLS